MARLFSGRFSPRSRRLVFAALASVSAIAALWVAGSPASKAQQSGNAAPPAPQLTMRLNDPQTLFQATIDNPKAVTGNVLEEGRLVVVGGSHQGGAGMACMSCHGAQGEGDNGAAFPRLAGLPAWYIYKQLDDYASGTRKNEVMSQIAQKLTDAERRAAASYYAVLTAPYPQLSLLEDAKTLQWGGQLAAVGSVNKDVPACTNCHGAKGEGVPPSVPYLSGQHAEYIIAQLHAWKQGDRNNDVAAVMKTVALKLDDNDIKAVAMYYSRLRELETQAKHASAAPIQTGQNR